MSGSTPAGVHVELYVRSLAPRGVVDRQRAVLDRLGHLDERGTVAGHRVHVCGRDLPATPADAVTRLGSFLLNRIAVFEEWADRNDHTLEAHFEIEQIDSQFTGQSHARIVMPVMTMAEYDGQDLRFVAPCSDGEQFWSVRDRLDYLAREGDRADRSKPLGRAHAEPPEETPLQSP